MNAQTLLANFASIADAPGGLQQLRRLVLDLAVRGRLVEQDTSDEPAAGLVMKCQAQRADLIAGGLIPKPRALQPEGSPIFEQFDLPFGWCWVSLDDLAVYIQRGKGPKYAPNQTGVPVVSQKCIQWAGFDLTPARYADEESLSSYGPERFLQPNDLLWNSTGTGTVGRAAVLPAGLPHRIVADSHVTVIRVPTCNARYVWTWLSSPFIQAQVGELTSGTTNQQELNTAVVRRLPIPVPPRAEQDRIVAKVDELMGLCDEFEVRQERRQRVTTRLRGSALHTLTEAESPDDLHRAWNRVSTNWPALTAGPDSISDLRQAILRLSFRGRLVRQRTTDDPVDDLLAEIALQRDRLPKRRGTRANGKDVQDAASGRALPPGWAEVSLGEITEIVRGITFPAGAKHSTAGQDLVPCLRTANVQQSVEWDDLIYVPAEYVTDESKLVRGGDLLMSMANSRELVGKVALVDPEPPHAAFGGFLAAIRPIVVSPKFVQLVLQESDAKSRLIDSATQTTNIANISLGRLRPFRCPLPPLEEQKRIVERVEELFALCDALQEGLRHSLEAQGSLLPAVIGSQ